MTAADYIAKRVLLCQMRADGVSLTAWALCRCNRRRPQVRRLLWVITFDRARLTPTP